MTWCTRTWRNWYPVPHGAQGHVLYLRSTWDATTICTMYTCWKVAAKNENCIQDAQMTSDDASKITWVAEYGQRNACSLYSSFSMKRF